MELHLFVLPNSFLFVDLTEHIFLISLFSISTVKLISLKFIVVPVFLINGLLILSIGFILTNLVHMVVEVVFFYQVVGLDVC